jgi:ssDNA-binding Zn-finger/Zn-ribbon topoisomerase 1
MPAQELLVPYGKRSDGELVHARSADRAVRYICPECDEELVLKAGPYVTHHFAHFSSHDCVGESALHRTAKNLLAQVIRGYGANDSGPDVKLTRRCDRCDSLFSHRVLRSRFDSAIVEYRIDQFLCDVVALREGVPVLAIEVLATHAVESAKASSLAVPWIEVAAESVLSDPYTWIPKNSHLKPATCPSCRRALEKLTAVATRWNLTLEQFAGYGKPERARYVAAIDSCWSCHNEIVLFWWDGVPFCQSEPPTPRPHTIAHRFSKTFGGKYWANTCPSCNAVQGDNFVFLGLNRKSRFHGLPMRKGPELRASQERAGHNLITHMLRNIGR